MLSVFVLAGCAAHSFAPTPVSAIAFESRAITEIQGPVRVSTAVPDAEETERLFGVPLYESGLQPVWLEIENQGEGPVRLALVSLDPEYFSPSEVAYMHRKGFSDEGRAAMEAWLHEQGMVRRILPGETRSGFVFTHLEPGTKAFNVDVYGNHEDYIFTFFVPVSGFTPGHAEVEFADLYRPDEVAPLGLDDLRQALSALQCCSTDESGERTGGPFNVALVGRGIIIDRALLRAGWKETAVARSHRYRGRGPDTTFHTVQRGGSQRMELRIWLSPMRVDDQPVWLGQVGNEMRRAKKDGTLVDSRIDPDLDAARMYLLQSLWYSQSLAQIGFTRGGIPAPIDAPRTDFTGAELFTDGLREVLWVAERPVGLDETVVLDWE